MRQLLPSPSCQGRAQVGDPKFLPTVNIFKTCLTSHSFKFRSHCLTKNYCGKECLKADQAVHTVCCKNLLDVDKRKWKKGGKEKEETASQNLEAYQSLCQLNLHQDEHRTQLKEVVANMKRVKVKKEAKVSEVD